MSGIDLNLTPHMRWALKRARNRVLPADTLSTTIVALERRGLARVGIFGVLTDAGVRRAQAPDVQEQEAPHGR